MTDQERILSARKHLRNNQDIPIKDQLTEISEILDIPVCDDLHNYSSWLCLPGYIMDPIELSDLREKHSKNNMPYTKPTLKELAFMYGTDKLSHGYMDFYEKYLPENPKKILEIGVREGRSIKMWQHYFPDAEIHGMDLFQEFDKPAISNVKWWKGHQADYYLLEQLVREDFDLIIDDGSHVSRHQMMTFFGLFNGKHYFIEDTHCCKDPFYQQSLPYRFTAEQIFNSLRYPHGYIPDVVSDNNIILIKCS